MSMKDIWVARDKDGSLFLYVNQKPSKEETIWNDYYGRYIEIDGSLFPEVQWSDEEPTKVRLVIAK